MEMEFSHEIYERVFIVSNFKSVDEVIRQKIKIGPNVKL
jgi:hypothetical protein